MILGACNPQLAHRALDVTRDIGLLLPCNVVVRSDGEGVIVQALDPAVISSVPGDPALQPIAEEAGRRIDAALESLGDGAVTAQVVACPSCGVRNRVPAVAVGAAPLRSVPPRPALAGRSQPSGLRPSDRQQRSRADRLVGTVVRPVPDGQPCRRAGRRRLRRADQNREGQRRSCTRRIGTLRSAGHTHAADPPATARSSLGRSEPCRKPNFSDGSAAPLTPRRLSLSRHCPKALNVRPVLRVCAISLWAAAATSRSPGTSRYGAFRL